MKRRLAAFSLMLVASLASTVVAAPPEVVASVRPVHAIAGAVMAGVETPRLLLPGTASPHAYAMRPSEARMLARADVVFWVGPSLETFMIKPLAALANKAQVVALATVPGVEVLPIRRGGVWGEPADDHSHDHGHDHDHGAEGGLSDGHIWLNPINAIAMANAMAEVLAAADPANATEYWDNVQTFAAQTTAMDRALHVSLAAVRAKPFFVFHDAYQYFETRYRLKSLGSISLTPEQPPGARRLAELQEKLRAAGPVCVFAEPQFEPRYVQVLTEGTMARTGVLDPEGSSLNTGPALYFDLMRGLADELIRCLQ